MSEILISDQYLNLVLIQDLFFVSLILWLFLGQIFEDDRRFSEDFRMMRLARSAQDVSAISQLQQSEESVDGLDQHEATSNMVNIEGIPMVNDSSEILQALNPSQRMALGCLRRNKQLTRRQICASLNWEPATTSRLLRPLVDAGLLVDRSKQPNEGGRRQSFLEINPKAGCAVGIEIGFMFLQVAVVDFGGDILVRSPRICIQNESPERVVALTQQCLKPILAKLAALPPLLGYGVSFCGVIDPASRVSRSYPGIQGWDHFPLSEVLCKSLSSSIEMEGDSIVGLLGEMRYGHALGIDNLLFVTMLDGIGLGILSNGLIHRGAYNEAGEFGHMCIIPEGPICYCGGSGCLESLASSWAICQHVRDKLSQGVQSRLLNGMPLDQIGIKEINQADREGEIFTRNILADAGRWLGNSLAAIANIIDPERIILAGILADHEENETLINSMKMSFERGLWHAKSRKIEMIPTLNLHDCYLIGAAALVFEKILPAYPAQLLPVAVQ